MSTIDKSIFIDAPVEEVFRLGWDPKSWEQWYTGLSGPDDMEGDGDAGSVLHMHYSMAGLQMPITVSVIEVSRTPDKSVWKGSFSGGINGSQTLTYTKESKGTHVDAHVEYTIPGKVMGKIGNTKVVEKLQEHAIEHSLSNLKTLAEHHM